MKKILTLIIRLLLRVFFTLLAKFAELIHFLARLALARLGQPFEGQDGEIDPREIQNLTVRQISEKFNISQRRAFELSREAKKALPSPEKQNSRTIRPFRTERLGNAMEH